MTPGQSVFWLAWLQRHALPLWASAGFDPETDSFVERLALDGTPQHAVPRRVMVQARQIYVYATAAHRGWYPAGADLAFRAADAMIARYHAPDCRPGWVFSCNRHGAIVDDRRDLYAHAFVLLALATLIRLEPRPRLIAHVQETMAFLDRNLAHPAGGYAEDEGDRTLPRRQNPHMHLFEAMLALHEGGACGDLEDRLATMVALFDHRFLPPGQLALPEYFDDAWNPVGCAGAFEPGHHFEWVWLLRRASLHIPLEPGLQIKRLLKRAVDGIDPQGRVIDQMGPHGPLLASCRIWPSMEAAKAVVEPQSGRGRALGTVLLLTAAWNSFIAPAIPGGWIDRIDPHGGALVDHMPASSLYHICTALEYLQDIQSSRPGDTVRDSL